MCDEAAAAGASAQTSDCSGSMTLVGPELYPPDKEVIRKSLTELLLPVGGSHVTVDGVPMDVSNYRRVYSSVTIKVCCVLLFVVWSNHDICYVKWYRLCM